MAVTLFLDGINRERFKLYTPGYFRNPPIEEHRKKIKNTRYDIFSRNGMVEKQNFPSRFKAGVCIKI